jgi:hypothetical protein
VGQRTFETRSLYLILAEKLFTLPAANEMLPLSALFAGKSRECRQGSADRLGITRRFMPTAQTTFPEPRCRNAVWRFVVLKEFGFRFLRPNNGKARFRYESPHVNHMQQPRSKFAVFLNPH